jgi:SAM-dependent methyltransferase
MDATVTERDPYSWAADRLAEERRLVAQGEYLEPVTEALLREAGIDSARRVVDLGSGAGDCALLAARLVGPQGSVLGVERSAEQVELARRRVAAMGLDRVAFVEGDVAGLEGQLAALADPVDAVIGRCILMWVPDRLAVLGACAQALPPGALVWFLEPDMEGWEMTHPSCPLWERIRGIVVDTVRTLGAEVRMDPRLHHAFRDAGLPAPELRCRILITGVATAPMSVIVNIVRAVLPSVERFGIATAAEVDIETLEERMRAEVTAVDGVVNFPPLFAAWTRIPG